MRSGIDRRRFNLASGLAAMAMTTPAAAQAAEPGLVAVELKVDGVSRPLGLENRAPSLSWRLRGHGRGLRQSAYRIEAASSAEALAAGHADLWDSGRIASSRNLGAAWGGPALASRQRVWWRVRVWDGDGREGAPSEAAWWEMGLLEPGDWSAGWLAVEDAQARDDRAAGLHWIWDGSRPDAAPRRFRFGFSLPAPARGALIIGARDLLRGVWIDGAALTLPVFAKGAFGPEPLVVLPIDLAAGEHLLAAEAACTPGTLLSTVGGLTAMLRLEQGGQTRRLVSGPEWKVAGDAPDGWTAPGFDDHAWPAAQPSLIDFGQPWPPTPALRLRTGFDLDRPVVRARLYATALGAYEARINGQRVGDALLTPESTDFRKRALYRVFDVTALIKPGANVLGATVGDGWYASFMAPLGRYSFGPAPRRFCAQLELTFADGSRRTVATGDGWRAGPSPILSSEIYNGEVYDARLDQPGWDAPGFDAAGWVPATAAEPPPARLVGQVDAPIRAERVMTALSVTYPAEGEAVFDFGQNFAGWGRLKVQAPAGTRITLRFAEVLRADGQVDQSNLRAAKATDVYVCRGDPAGETYEPHFTYHGFRYVQISGYPGRASATDLDGVVIHSGLDLTGALRIDNAQIEQVWRNALWSQRSNFMGVPTDCPQRDERLGWMGDANVFWDAAAFNMDVDAFTRRFAADMRDAQTPHGAYRDFAPFSLSFAPESASPGWADAGVVLPWTVWRRYGDTGIIDENWDAMSRYSRFIADANPDFVWRNKRGLDYGDWLALDAKAPGDPTTPKALVATACWAQSTEMLRQMAEATGRAEAAAAFADLHGRIAEAFRQAFVQPGGVVGNASQTSYILALRYGLLPEALRRPAAERLAADIRRRGVLLSTGFLGTPNSLDVLAEAGYPELVYDLLLRSDYPSWGYMVRKGATTMWERWNGDVGDVAMNSYNHYAFGAVSGFLFRRIAGLEPSEPGFAAVEVRPVLDMRVASAGADYDSAMGRFSINWRRRRGGRFELDLTVPPNARAIVRLPAAAGSAREGGRPTGGRSDISNVPSDVREVALAVGSGTYAFSSKLPD